MDLKKQTRFGWPRGNCLQACIASLVGCEVEALPEMIDETYWREELNEYLQREHGLIYHEIPYNEKLFWWADSLVVGLGPTNLPNAPKDSGHAVIIRLAVIDREWVVENVHDPMPDEKFLPQIDSIGVLIKQFILEKS